MLGHQFFATVPDIDRTDYFLMLGTNPKISNGAMMSTGANVHKKLNAIRERGGKTVLIDPRRNETAPYCDEHHFINPIPTPCFLWGSLSRSSITNLPILDDLSPISLGFDQIEMMIEGFELNDIAVATGISVETIERLAWEFANAEKAVCYGRTGVSMVEFGGLCLWLIMVLNIITGNLDKPGGMMFPRNAIDSLPATSSSL